MKHRRSDHPIKHENSLIKQGRVPPTGTCPHHTLAWSWLLLLALLALAVAYLSVGVAVNLRSGRARSVGAAAQPPLTRSGRRHVPPSAAVAPHLNFFRPILEGHASPTPLPPGQVGRARRDPAPGLLAGAAGPRARGLLGDVPRRVADRSDAPLHAPAVAGGWGGRGKPAPGLAACRSGRVSRATAGRQTLAHPRSSQLLMLNSCARTGWGGRGDGRDQPAPGPRTG